MNHLLVALICASLCTAGLIACAQQQPVATVAVPGFTSCARIAPSSDTTVYDSSQVDELPVRRAGPFPEYPATLRDRGIGGQADARWVVLPNGTVDQESISVTASHPDLSLSVREAIRQTTFWPGCRSGQPVRVRLSAPTVFSVQIR